MPLVTLLIMQAVWNCAWSFGANRLYFSIHSPKRTVIIYRNENDLKKLKQLKKYEKKFKIEKYIENPKSIKQLLQDVKGYEVIFAVGIGATLRNGIVKYCVETNVQGYIEPKVGDIIMTGAKEMQSFNIPIWHVRKAVPKPEYLVFKRLMDIIVSLAILVVTWPIMLATAIAIKVYDNGPILYKQTRLTKNGRHFDILNLRWMDRWCMAHKIIGILVPAFVQNNRVFLWD